MKKFLKSRTSKILLTFSMFASMAVPALANANSDGAAQVDSSMSPAAVIGSVAFIIGLVILLAAKGSSRVSVQK
ncbi:MAG: hypothetical protein QM726_12300 [Chitinophagaceae bacterium]